MFGLEIIEVAIGLVFTYLVLATVCSGIFEVWAKISGLRARHLEQGLRRLLADPEGTGFVRQLYSHYLISSPLEDKLGKPTQISADKFATAVFDILGDGSTDEAALEKVREKIERIPDARLKARLISVMDSSANRLESARTLVETWFDDSMQAVTAWYVKRSQFFVMLCSAVIVISFNADSIRIARTLWNDNELRSSVVAASESYAQGLEKKAAAGGTTADLEQAVNELRTTIDTAKALPVGWLTEKLPYGRGYSETDAWIYWLLKALGFLMSIGAVSMGSSFWYRLLGKLLAMTKRDAPKDESAPTIVVVPQASTPTAGAE